MTTPLFTSGSGPVTSIVNYFSGGGVSTAANIATNANNNAKEILSGALTANTLASLPGFPLTGRGRLNLLTAYAKDATSRTIRVQVIVDGTTLYDATSDAITNSGSGVVPVGVVTAATGALEMQPIDFQTSLDIKIASSLSETNKVGCGINYETWA
jgi:hypothetical protein